MDESYPLLDSQDSYVLMHRDVHFNGDFDIMYDYYKNEGKGVHPDITLKQIEKLRFMETQGGQNLAPIILQEAEMEKVVLARQSYETIKAFYDNPKEKSPVPRLISDLILSEEEFPEQEINQLIDLDRQAVPFLIELLQSEEFQDPLYPGYGSAPQHAAYILGKIKDESAIAPLFGSIGRGDFNYEETILQALVDIGHPARQFLTKILTGKPLVGDHEKAAMALAHFAENDNSLAELFLYCLEDSDYLNNPTLAVHLILALKNLQKPSDIERFLQLTKSSTIPALLQPDFTYVTSCLKSALPKG